MTLDEGCKIIRLPVPDDGRHQRNFVRVACLGSTEIHQPVVHHDCSENQIRSLVGRVAGVTPKPSPYGLARLRSAVPAIKRNLPHTTANPMEDMPARYSGMKRKRYERALNSVNLTGLSRADAAIKMFVKPERFNPAVRANPDPRAIQFRAAKYCVVLASYLHPIEHHIYNLSCASAGVEPSRNVAKGLNSVARAELLMRKLAEFNNPTMVGLDASRFDKHVSRELLSLEHSIYLSSNPDPEFRQLLSWQLSNTCFSNLGLIYKVRGRRMSGDMNTAAGNCLLMLLMLMSFFQGVKKWDCLDDGDDVVVIVEAESIEWVLSNVHSEFLHYGMQMKVESITNNPLQVVFCRSMMVEYHPGRFKFIRDFRLVMSNALCGIRHWQDETYRRRVINAVGTCELVLNLGVPILQEFAVAILRNCPSSKVLDLSLAPEGLLARTKRDLRLLGIDPSELRPQPVLPCARASFAAAYGVDEIEQIKWEERLRKWTFTTIGRRDVPCELEVHTWTYEPALHEVYTHQENEIRKD